MKINYTSNNYNISDKFKEIVEKKLQKLNKYFKENAIAKVNCSVQAKQEKLEITIDSDGVFFKGAAISNNMYNNLDLVLPKIERQVIKHGTRFASKLKKGAFESKELLFLDDIDETNITPKVVKNKKYELEPLLVEDAEAYMEALGHSFYIFLNADTGKVNVLYKRNDDNYGIIEVTY